MSKLTAIQRARLSSSAFAFLKTRSYPIHDVTHQRNALARAKQYGGMALYNKVKIAIINSGNCLVKSICPIRKK